MNIVKGVAGFIKRTSSGHHGGSTFRVDRFNLPRNKVCFSEVGPESMLNSLWQRYESAHEKAEKRQLFYAFLKQFLDVFRRWEPDSEEEDADINSATSSPLEHSSQCEDKIGCSFGHPTEVLLALIEDVGYITSLVTEMHMSPDHSTSDRSSSLTIISEGMPLLEALVIVARSTYNSEVLGYHGMVQKLIALIKAAVVQLKTISGVLPADDSPTKIILAKYRMLQKLLVHVLSIICSFIELKSDAYEVAQYFSLTAISNPKDGLTMLGSFRSFNGNIAGPTLSWKEKAVTTVMEVGGLNWFVELLRVVRILNLKEQKQNMSLQYLILRALYSSISDSSRAQNHFRSIGGLEVLLDGVVLISDADFPKRSATLSLKTGKENIFLGILQLHVLSMEVLREAIYGNLINLQFLCESGRVHKLANSFCSPAFILQECKRQILVKQDASQPEVSSEYHNNILVYDCFLEVWKNYSDALSRVLCSFILTPEDEHSKVAEVAADRNTLLVSAAYIELSIKWILKVLWVVFPYIKACSTEDELPMHLRLFVITLLRHVLHASRKILISSPLLLDVFREERIWELVFSDNFLNFGPAMEEYMGISYTSCGGSIASLYPPSSSAVNCSDNAHEAGEVTSPQMEVISFVEFAAMSSGSTHNVPECSALLDALEQSSADPEVAITLAKSMVRLFQLSPEKTVASFKKIDAVSRVLKVACIQAQKYRTSENVEVVAECSQVDLIHSEISQRSDISVTSHRWHECIEASVELFTMHLSRADDAKSLVLNSSACIDCLFELFWVEDLRNFILGFILDLMKTTPNSEEDKKGKLHLCSKYFETFNQVKEKEKDYTNISIDLLDGMREMLAMDQSQYQALFCDGECFLHVVSLLNGVLATSSGEKVVLSVLQTLISLLANNDASKAAFRSLVGRGYQTLQNLLLDYCRGHPTEQLLNALLDMLVDGKFDIGENPLIQNEDAILLYLSVLQKSSDSLRQQGLNVFLQLLRDSISNRDACVRAGMLNFLLDWFSQEESDNVILKIAQLIQVTGGHSISGKDIRKIFALLRSEKVGNRQQYGSLLMNSILSMLNEKGPTAFFDLIGNDSGIIIRTPMHWPINKGFTFSCWLRVENFPRVGGMGLFSFFSEHGKGCFALLTKDKLIYESIYQKRQCVSLNINIATKKWHFVCITHIIGRAFSGGSVLRCYVNGALVSSERCRYPRVNELFKTCSIGCKVHLPNGEEENPSYSIKEASSFLGQIGPVYMFNDAITPEQVIAINSLGPSYMYSFLDNEDAHEPLPGGVFDAKDGLAAKMIFGLNAQASNGRVLYNVAPLLESAPDKSSLEAIVLTGTQLCSRRLLQQIIYVVGGVSVFFPLLTQSQWYENEEHRDEHSLLMPITKERLTAEVIELIASVLDENLANQQQMNLISGFSILGFLLQSVPPQQLNLQTLSALKHLFNVVANSGLSEFLVKEAVSCIFLNPLVWVTTGFQIQRELCLFLSQQFDNDPRLLSLCRLPRILDLIHLYYWDNAKCRSFAGGKRTLPSMSETIIGERPSRDEIQKIRLLLLSLGEMSLRQSISSPDVKALIAFFETSQDMACIEDVLHMVIRATSLKSLLAKLVDQLNSVGGCQVFINLLQREYEPIRLLSLQFLGRILVDLPSEKKGLKFFSLGAVRSKSISESTRRMSFGIQQLLFSAMSDRLFRFPVTEDLCAALFDALLGGASPKQVLQKQSQFEKQKTRRSGSQFCLPQILPLIFKILTECENVEHRTKITDDLLDLLESNPSNIESLMENGWNAWLTASMELAVVKNYKLESYVISDKEISEQRSVRNLYSTVLGHYILSIKGGWQFLEDTSSFILMNFEQGGVSFHYFLRDLYEDLIWKLWKVSSEDNILALQPCRDNTLYLLKLIDELLLSEVDHKLPFPASSELPPDFLDIQSSSDIVTALSEALVGSNEGQISSNLPTVKKTMTTEEFILDEEWWMLYDLLWIIISEMNGKGQRKMLQKSTSSAGPSLGQRARGLYESLNIPAAEMAAVVVTGGISNALGGKSNKSIDKAMLLRGEKCPRIVFRLLVLYICRASLPRASRCVQQLSPLLPSLLVGDDENSKNRLQLFIWSLLAVQSEYGMLDDGTRSHVISHLIVETVKYGKSMLATSIAGRDDSSETGGSNKDSGFIQNLIQKDRILDAVLEESNYIKTLKSERSQQLHEWRTKMDESVSGESSQKKTFEDEMQGSLSLILASDDNRRSAFQLAYDEERQTVAEKWIHVFRSLIDERGPWSANPFPNCDVRHWKLDKTEDLWRRRPKLRQNYRFDEKLCHPSASAPYKEGVPPTSEIKLGSGLPIPEQMKQLLLKGIRRITDEVTSELSENDSESSSQKSLHSKTTSDQESEPVKENTLSKDPLQERKESSSTEVEGGEVLMSVPCVLITPKRKLFGQLAIMQSALHFFGEFLVEGTAGYAVFKNFDTISNSESGKQEHMTGIQKQKLLKLPAHLTSYSENQNSLDSVDKQPKNIKRHRRWNISKVKAVHWTRYLIRYTAIEVFFSNSVAPVFFNFASQQIAKDIGTLLVNARNESLFPKGINRDRIGAIALVDRRIAQELAETARESWRRREMTNFEYLMILNTLAGRSYNDLTQYPVFPWVLADYSSETLDFNKSSTFRDLSKPVGALDPKRFEVFEDRYRSFDDPDIPSFYYGSHYSSGGIVLYFLIRLEPFATLHRNLQGGKFDHADRLFQSIEGSYRNCLSNTSDVKELIPEFFYMPECFVNSNSYHLGVRQDGEPIGDVCLPPWAKGSPEEFISKNREALESEYVSSNLHNWIDLIFGYKQRGKSAVEAANIFYYLTYEGAVDLENMEDEMQRSAIEDQIANFGQTPIQIFRKKHPRRGPPIPIAHPLRFAPGSINLTSVVSSTRYPASPILYVNVFDSNVVLVSQGLTMSVKIWLTTQLQSGGNFTFSSSQEPYFGIGSDILSYRKIGSPLAEGFEPGAQCFATLQTPSENFLISCGNWENSFQVISLSDGRVVQSTRAHKDIVSAVAVTSDGSILATGSFDTTVMVWEVQTCRGHEKRARNVQSEVPRKDCIISETPFHILCGHDDIITCLYVSVELDIVISGSKDGTCVFHTLRGGKYVMSIRHPCGSPLSKLVVSRHGWLVLYSDDDLSLHLYTINGKHIATSESNGRLNCVQLSVCGEFLACAGDQGQVTVRSMRSLELVMKYAGAGKVITSLAVTPEECFIAGTKEGIILVYSIENPQLRKANMSRSIKSRPSSVG